MKAICEICHKYVKVEKVINPRSKGEVHFVCNEHGIVNFVEFRRESNGYNN